MANEEHINPIMVFISAFTLASFAGLAALLRSGTPLSWKSITSATLNSGLLSIAIAMIWYTQFADNIFFLCGICVLSGLGGMTAIDFVLAAVKKGGFNISFTKNEGVKLGESEDKNNVAK